MKDSGIGTPATRASIIETLLEREYITRNKCSLVPTEKGLAVYSIVKSMRIADVEMTGMWEKALLEIEKGKMDAQSFRKSIEIYTKQITAELLSTQLGISSTQPDLQCPKCK